MNILVTGGNGYIAQALKKELQSEHTITTITRADFDLSDSFKTKEWFSERYFDAVIHTAISGGSRLQKDSMDVLDANLKMYYNLLDNREKYSRFISIGSGAELYYTDTPYGLSKHIIRQSILYKPEFYNIRVFAVFDENELGTRFIKANLLNYINKKPMVLYQNKKMDFFYMKDFVSIVRHYVHTTSVPKEIDCAYKTSYYLSDILTKINNLSSYSVPILDESNGLYQQDYTGKYTDLNLTYDGLDVGIQTIYQKLLCKK